MKKMKKAMLITASIMLLGTAGTYTAVNQMNQPQISEEVGAAKETKFAKTNYKTKANLNLRSQASTKGKVLVTIPKNTTVASSARIGNWYKVSYKGKTGYVSGSYLSKVSAPAKKAPAPKTVKFKAKTFQTTANLNVRATASAKGKYLTRIPKGTKVSSGESYNGWYKVKYKGKTGWAHGGYLKEVKPAKKPAPKPAPKAPAFKSKTEVEKILSKAYTKYSDVSYALYFKDVEYNETHFLGEAVFPSKSSGRAELVITASYYNSAIYSDPKRFGQDEHDYQMEVKKAYENAIGVYAESQIGSAHASTFVKEVYKFATDTKRPNAVNKTIGGMQFKFEEKSGGYIITPR